jgi:hypothetical protein
VVDANLLVREFLLGQTPVTALLGTNANSSIYCGYDLPEHFDPTLGPAIQIFRVGGLSHSEITVLVDARVHIRVWAAVEKYFLASQVYSAINDVLHGLCGFTLTDGTIIRALEVTAPSEMTDPETGYVAVYAFYAVMARPNGSTVPTVYIPQFYSGSGAPGALHNEDDVYFNVSTGDLYEQVAGSWVLTGNVPQGGGTEMPSLTYHKVSAASNNAANIKPSAGVVTGWKIYNNSGAALYVKLFNKATTPVPGTDTPQQTIGVDAGESDLITSAGYTYAAGIGIAIVKNIGDADNTSVAANDCVVDIFYQ